jgi:hypothetical protein
MSQPPVPAERWSWRILRPSERLFAFGSPSSATGDIGARLIFMDLSPIIQVGAPWHRSGAKNDCMRKG